MIIDLWPLSIKIDVLLIQIINVLILLYIFKKLFGNTLTQEVAKRRELTRKLQAAEVEYNSVIAQANHEKEIILTEAMEHKKHIIAEAEWIAQQNSNRLLQQAKEQADVVLKNAEKEAEHMQHALEKQRSDSVKKTAWLLVKKIFKKDVELKQEYMSMLLQETDYVKNGK